MVRMGSARQMSEPASNKAVCLAAVAAWAVLMFAAITFDGSSSGRKDVPAAEFPEKELGAASVSDTSLPGRDEFVEVDQIAEMIHMQAPEYPSAAQQASLQGTAWIKELVRKDGSASDPFLYRSSGHKYLDDAALRAAPGNKFKPAIKDGKPVAMWVVFKYEFILNK